ncbi:MAG: flagellar protein FlaG [Thermodesulfobacteriaceae bacterium]|nr:flagellar protein FlaG [Thermodesulfobacteriaceae bacterium]MDW8135981.1 flagellar protein FlaG [Thermodesulfobacterium sp.]
MKVDNPLGSKINIEELIKGYTKESQNLSLRKLKSFTKTQAKISNLSKRNPLEKDLFQGEILDIIKEIDRKLSLLNKGLKIEIDEELKIPVFKIIDLETKEVLRQIPWEELLKLRKILKNLSEKELKNREFLKGLFLEKEV